MRSEIHLLDGSDRAIEEDRATLRPEIPCFRCGVCCVRWQPLLSPAEQRRLAQDIGVSLATFKRKYTRAYPIRRGWRQLITADHGGCVFLVYEGGRAGCSIHAVRPTVCRDWAPSLEKKECLTGLQTLATGGFLTIDVLYDDPKDKSQFLEMLLSGEESQPPRENPVESALS